MLWFSSDVKNFCQNQMGNSQNNHWFTLSPQNVPILMKSKYPVPIMKFRVFTSDCDVMSPFIFCRFNAEGNTKCQEEVALLWIEEITAGRSYIWQNNSAPYHTSRKTQYWLWEDFCKHIIPNIWSPNSPDWNFLDYYVWSTVKWDINKTLCKDELTARIRAEFTNLN